MLCKKRIKTIPRACACACIKDYGTSNRHTCIKTTARLTGKRSKAYKMRIRFEIIFEAILQDFYAVDKGFCRC